MVLHKKMVPSPLSESEAKMQVALRNSLLGTLTALIFLTYMVMALYLTCLITGIVTPPAVVEPMIPKTSDQRWWITGMYMVALGVLYQALQETASITYCYFTGKIS